MAKALYRKYRPKKLADVIGQEQVTGILANSLKQGKISHAYLFIGPRGTGKTSVARIFAHEVNGFKYELEDNYVDNFSNYKHFRKVIKEIEFID